MMMYYYILQAVIECCKKLSDRIRPFREKVPKNQPRNEIWKQLVRLAFISKKDLSEKLW